MKDTVSQSHAQQRIDDARAGVSTESHIPNFAMFALRGHGLSHQHLLCILEIKAQTDDPHSSFPTATPQIVTQAGFAFDAFPGLPHVFSIIAFGDAWRMYRFLNIYEGSRTKTRSIW